MVIKKDVSKWNKKFGYEYRMKKIRGKEISLAPQDAASSLNPFHRIKDQIKEAYLLNGVGREEVKEKVNDMLERLGLTDKALDYPHRLSGGMCRRIVIGIGLASDPALLIADEPTNGIDSPLKIKIIELFEEFMKRGRSILLIAHDIEIIRALADRVIVMYSGKIVEEGPVEIISKKEALHPYTKGLIGGGYIGESFNVNLGNGCKFYNRCKERREKCLKAEPNLAVLPNKKNHWVRCHRVSG
jgi:ABC-type dipeptide/oligopeptide/nickel transport system ATPase component